MTAIETLIDDIKRALQKPEAEQEIALRVIKDNLEARLTELESVACEVAVKIVDSMILDTMTAPGLPSPLENRSPQDVLVIARGRLLNALELPPRGLAVGIPSEEIARRAKNALQAPRTHKDPRHESKRRTGKGG